MTTESGEYIVGAYLQHFYDCDLVLYNQRLKGGKLAGLLELDVVGISLQKKEAYLCEVTTHILGMLIKNRTATIEKVKQKYMAQQAYAKENLEKFNVRYMLWSPVVKDKKMIASLHEMRGLQIVINGEYKKRVEQLRELAAKCTHDMGNPFMRTMQILSRLRDD